MLEFYIDGEKQSVRTNSLQMEDEIDSRSICSFIVKDLDNSKEFKRGQPVTIEEPGFMGMVVFRGFIEMTDKIPVTNSGSFEHFIECTDNHYLADKRLVSLAAVDKPAGQIAQDIVDDYLSEENVSTSFSSIEDGKNVKEAIFSYVPASQALDSLAEQAGFWWKIDMYKRLHFRSRESNINSIPLTREDIRGKPIVRTGNPLYRNVQYIKGGVDVTDEQSEVFTADDEQVTFTVGFRIIKKPMVEVDYGFGYEEETVERKGMEEGQWFWGKGENTVVRSRDEDDLSSGDRVRITYVGEFDMIAVSRDNHQIAEREQIENTSGIVEDSVVVDNVESRESGLEKANAKLAKYAKQSISLQFTTRRDDFEAGELMTVEGLSELGISEGEELLIKRVYTYDENGIFLRDINAVKGPEHRSWAEFFRELNKRAELIVREGVSEAEVLIVPIEFDKEWTEVERPNIFHEKYPGDNLYPSDNIYPMFRSEERVKYLAWYDGEVELGRKEFTQQEGAESDEIFTLTFLGPEEALEENRTHFGWVGGFRATQETDSGVIVDKQEYDAAKSDLEAWQIEKTDFKWEA